MTQLAERDRAAIVERVMILNDLRSLEPEERIAHYRATCESLGLNWLTRPFSYLEFQGRVILYANKDASEQLRKINDVSIVRLEREKLGQDVYTVTAYACLPNGRQDSSIGAVPIAGLRGPDLANAIMKCETKAKRRVTLSICGLGMVDETELATMMGARMLSTEDFEAGQETVTETVTDSTARPVRQEPASAQRQPSLAELWAKLQRQGAELGITIRPMDPEWTNEQIKENYNGFRDLIVETRREKAAQEEQARASQADHDTDLDDVPF